jgi:carbon storage regulator
MLVLTRKIGQKILIADGIEVTITAVQGDKVRVGISAPQHIRVEREELRMRGRQCVAASGLTGLR